jgi:hypothetical protein
MPMRCARSWSLRWSTGRYAGPELTVARITETGHDKRRLVEPFVDRRGEHSRVRRYFLNRRKAFRRGHHTEHADIRRAAALQQFDRVRHRPAGRQHRVKHHDRSAFELLGQRFHVRKRQTGFLVAGDADEPDLGLRDRGLRLVDHPQPGPQHRNQQRRIEQSAPERLGQWRPDPDRLTGRVPGGLVNQYQRQLAQRGPKAGRIGAFVSQRGQPGCGQRVVNYAHLHALEGI